MLTILLSGRARLITHVVGWALVALLFLLFNSLRGPVEALSRTTLNLAFLLVLFYGNAKILINRYFETGRFKRLIALTLVFILYIEGWKEYVKIFTTQEKVITLESLNHLEQTLPTDFFLRVHKSYIVAKQAVRQLDGSELLIGKARIPVARARKRFVLAALFPS